MPKFEPVRWYAIILAILAIAAHYLPDLPTLLYAGLAAAVLGIGGEVVRHAVTPTARYPDAIEASHREGGAW